MTFDVLILEPSEFWNEVKGVEKKVKQLAEKRGHTIVAGGMLGGNVAKKPRAYLNAWFVLTQKEGETFLCLLNIDSFRHSQNIDEHRFSPCRIHHIAGTTRKKDLLFVEWSSGDGKRKVYAFQYHSEVPTQNERSAPKYRAQDYQHLIGKSKSDVKKILRLGICVTGITQTEIGNTEFAEYNGMTVLYGVDGLVIKVVISRH